MFTVLTKAFAFILIIILGFVFKKCGIFNPGDHKLVSKIMMNLTLPCAIISSFANFQMDNSIIFIILIGLVCNIIMVFIGYIFSLKKNNTEKAFYMINFSGYNIGSFTMPYVQSFLGPFGVVVTCMFDAGNSIMCTGGTYAIASSIAYPGSKNNIKDIFKKLVSSVPFDTYTLMLILTMIGVQIPKPIITIISPISAANGFIAMLMLGMMFEFTLDLKYLKQIITALAIRYLSSCIFAFLIYFYSPFSLEIRQVLTIAVFAPISALVAVFTEKCGGNVNLSSAINSMSIPISIIIITTLLLTMNI